MKYLRPTTIIVFFIILIGAGLIERMPAEAQGGGTITQLDQFVATTTPTASITQRIINRPLKITGLDTGECLTLDANNILVTTNAACGSGGGGSGTFGQAWELITNAFGISALAPTTTVPIAIQSSATSTFLGGIESWAKIAAPYFNGTSTATSTFGGGLNLKTGCLAYNGTCISTGGGGSGDVVGPASSGDNNIAVFDGLTGKLIKDGGVTIASLVPYSGATGDLDLGANDLQVRAIFDSGSGNLTFQSAGFDFSDDGVNLGTLDFTGLTGVQTFTFPDSSGTLCTTVTCGGGGGSFQYDWQKQSNAFGVNALTPTTTIPIWIKGSATSTFAGGLEVWTKIAAPYFIATSTTATSTFANGINLTGGCFASGGTCIPLPTQIQLDVLALLGTTATIAGILAALGLSGAKFGTTGFTVSGSGSAITTGKADGYFTCPYAGNITAWNLSLDAGTATVKVWKIAAGTAVPTIANSINTSGLSISSGTSIRSTTLTDFTTTAVAANDIFAFDVTAVAGGATELSFNVEITKS